MGNPPEPTRREPEVLGIQRICGCAWIVLHSYAQQLLFPNEAAVAAAACGHQYDRVHCGETITVLHH